MNGDDPPSHYLKLQGYMICTLSKHEAEKDGYTDSLMLIMREILQATGANIFFKDKNGNILTPHRYRGIRRTVSKSPDQNIVHERKILQKNC